MISVEYILALKDSQEIESLSFKKRTRLKEVLPYFSLDKIARMTIKNPIYGIFNQIVTLDYELLDGDRIEVYRPLTIDPKKARLIRAEHQKHRRSKIHHKKTTP